LEYLLQCSLPIEFITLEKREDWIEISQDIEKKYSDFLNVFERNHNSGDFIEGLIIGPKGTKLKILSHIFR
jgi:hypothetical protein